MNYRCGHCKGWTNFNQISTLSEALCFSPPWNSALWAGTNGTHAGKVRITLLNDVTDCWEVFCG
jgi:hypothetical protein